MLHCRLEILACIGHALWPQEAVGTSEGANVELDASRHGFEEDFQRGDKHWDVSTHTSTAVSNKD